MNNIAKNIKRLRTEKDMTQDELAEKMHVTRQTVSNWETEKNQPDIDTLACLAQVFETDLNEIIYGNKRNEYPRFQTKYIKTAAFSAVALVLLIILRLNMIPWLEELRRKTFMYTFELIILKVLSMSMIYFFLGILVPAVFSLWADCRASRSRYYLPAALLLMLPAAAVPAEYLVWKYLAPSYPMYILWGTVEHRWIYPVIAKCLPCIAGLLIFLRGNIKNIQ